ncbi:MAG TPA: branched-chain amino acid ABC transporter permease [Methylomirabilota bacterium]|nr:branched-chain amino acid ABC transporter permease [Methylomirabilota bacterium]
MTPTEILLQVLINGLLIGFTLSLIASGLTLIYGVMNIVNFAHGEFLMLAMYATFFLYARGGIDPLAALPLTVLLLFAIGRLTYSTLIRRVMRGPGHAQIFATFGLMIALQGTAQFVWGADYHAVGASAVSGRLVLGRIVVSLPQLASALGALAGMLALWLLLERTTLGRALRATAQDRDAAALLGINTERIYGLAWGIGAACVGVAGTLLATHYYIVPRVGAVFALVAFATVALGGFGSIGGAFVAGITIGVVEVAAGYFVTSLYKYVFVYGIYLLVVVLRPAGLLGRW